MNLRSVIRAVAAYLLTLFALHAGISAGQPAGWQMAPPLPKPLGEIVGAVAAGKWYVLGGLDPQTSKPLGIVYMFDPSTGRWTEKKPMPIPAHHIMVAPLNDKIYVFGGFTSPPSGRGWAATDRAWVYDPANDSWTELPKMPTARGAGSAVELNGKIYVIGGARANAKDVSAAMTPDSPQLVLGTVEEFDSSTREWRSRASMPTPRNHLLAAAADGKIYAIGGRVGSAQITVADDTDVVEAYDPLADQWSNRGRAPLRCSGMTGGAHDGEILMAGGEYQDWEGAKACWAVESFDPRSGAWNQLPRMRLAHHGFASGFLGDTMHVVGGGFQSDGMPGVNTKTDEHEVLSLEVSK
jgi:N-acetylneuraminic acid mutarotase